MKLFVLIFAFIALWSTAQADECVTTFDACGILVENTTCSIVEDCTWSAGTGCAMTTPICPDYDNQEDCSADFDENGCAWDVEGTCDPEANIIGCLVNPDYFNCLFAESFISMDFNTTNFEELAAERSCYCATSQLACLRAENCFDYYDDLVASQGLNPDDVPSLCETVITAFATELGAEDKTCNDICDTDFGYANGNATWDLSMEFDKNLTTDEVEKAVAGGIVGVEVSDVTATRVEPSSKSAVSLMADKYEFDIQITIPAGRPMSAERLEQIDADLNDIENNKYVSDTTGAKATVTNEPQKVSEADISNTSGATSVAISMVSMIIVAILAIIA